jgi:hypothetical protein
MADVLQYLKLVPDFAVDFVNLLASPKTFLADHNKGDANEWPKALLFFLICTAISSVLQALYVTGVPEFAILLLRSVVVWGIGGLLFSVAIKAAWMIVGGRAPFASIFLTHLYVYSIFILILNLGTMAQMNLLGLFRKRQYDSAQAMVREGDLGAILRAPAPAAPDDPVSIALNIIILFTGALFIGWIVLTWGAYRKLNAASRRRSGAAFLICGLLSVPVHAFLFVITRGGFGLSH